MGPRFTEEAVLSTSDPLEIIFPNSRTRIASRIFIDWLKEKGGSASKKAVSEFADELQEKRYMWNGAPYKYSRRNFYMTILKRLVQMGFLRRNVPVWDKKGKSTVYAYARNIFDIPQKPPSVGFWRLSYYIAKKWNQQFISEKTPVKTAIRSSS